MLMSRHAQRALTETLESMQRTIQLQQVAIAGLERQLATVKAGMVHNTRAIDIHTTQIIQMRGSRIPSGA